MAEVKRVMISSTSLDLPHHRDQARDACLSQGMFPVMMEHLPATDASAMAVSLGMVGDSDVYLGIIGDRYGYVPSGHKLSITEMEYDRAAELGIPRLIFVAADDTPATNHVETGEAAERLAAFKKRLKAEAVVQFFKSPDDLRACILLSLARHRDRHPTKEYPVSSRESATFSRSIKDEMARLNKAIDQLTHDQFKVIDFLSGHRRVAITGGAGSGKTLVAAEKAVRLAHAGLRTLMLCHNPHLASHIARMVATTRVEVADFAQWIAQLVGDGLPAEGAWSHYVEPPEEELEQAFDILTESDRGYDAIIVDEAQDFRDEWWLVVEAALRDPERDILYIFHDNNQALLPHRSRYPVVQSPIVLTQNCRNAGEVFDVVTAFHYRLRQTPPPELLERTGVCRKWIFEEGHPVEATTEAVRAALDALDPAQLVVLTIEDPQGTPLDGLEIPLTVTWSWQDKIRYYFEYLPKGLLFQGDLPRLSDAPTPTPADVAAVAEFATRIHRTLARPDDVVSTRPKWVLSDGRLRLLPLRMTHSQRLHFFTTPDWADSLPEPQRVRLVPASRYRGDDGEILLASVSDFKGLESDGVVLCATRPANNLRAGFYVGSSRARFLLHLVVDPRSNALLPREAGGSSP